MSVMDPNSQAPHQFLFRNFWGVEDQCASLTMAADERMHYISSGIGRDQRGKLTTITGLAFAYWVKGVLQGGRMKYHLSVV